MIMFWKEWRELVRTLPIAIVLISAVLYLNLPSRSTYHSRVDLDVASAMALWGVVYSLILALLQIWSEQRTDVRGWLLTRPIPRWKTYWCKTLAALLVYVLALLVPWLVAWIWLGTVAPRSRPADQQMLIPGFLVYLAAFSFHPATIWMISREARWVGSKAIVLVLPSTVTFLAYLALSSGFGPLGWSLIGVVVAFFVVVFPTVAQYAYVYQGNQPTRVHTRSVPALLSLVALSASVIIVGAFATVMLSASLAAFIAAPTDGMHPGLRTDPQGRLFETKERYVWNEDKGMSEYQVVKARHILPINSTEESISLSEVQFADLQNANHWLTRPDFGKRAPFAAFTNCYSNRQGLTWYFHDDGYYLAYVDQQSVAPTQDLLAVRLDRSGFNSTNTPFLAKNPIQTFDSATVDDWIPDGTAIGLVDSDGIYLASMREQTLRPVLQTHVDDVTLFFRLGDRGPTAIVRHDRKLSLYSIERTGETFPSPEEMKDRAINNDNTRCSLPPFRLTLQATLSLPEDWFDPVAGKNTNAHIDQHVQDMSDLGFQFNQRRHGQCAKSIRITNDGNLVEQKQYLLPPSSIHQNSNAIVASLVTPLANIGFATVLQTHWLGWPEVIESPRQFNSIIAFGAIFHWIAAWLLTSIACRRRLLSMRATWLYRGLTLILGVITPLVVLCLHPRVKQSLCATCKRRIRVDSECCPHCQAQWDPPKPIGIEVIAIPHQQMS